MSGWHRQQDALEWFVARIVEDSLLYLEAPIKRVTGYDTIIPFFANEKTFLPDVGKIVKATIETVRF